MRGPDHAWMLAVRKWSREEERMSQHTQTKNCWVFVKGEKIPRNVTPLPRGSARWYADTLAIELGTEVRVFRINQKAALGRLVSTHNPLENG